ncbi:BadF/BadG/BcrA/BcrD ATPase family protein [Cryobacterium frigoriphilum]|nr:BadF/BadG/BcrA/BcrD ATPase family protein [Cryobacterium frigoriphilum]
MTVDLSAGDTTLLAIDAGQTGIRARLQAPGSVARVFDHDAIRTDSALVPQLETVVAQVRAATGQSIDAVSAGISGFTAAECDPGELLRASASSGVREVFLAHDSVTSYLGALGGDLGVVVAAGTGVVTLAVGASTVARIDGWGNLIGDAGSGYWLGRAALDAVMRAHDGRGPQTALTSTALREFADLELAYLELQADPGRVRRIASYARWVTEHAQTDAVAASICAAAADELVLSAATGLRQVGEAARTRPVASRIGGVFASTAISARFDAGLRAIWPTVHIRAAAGTSLDGAAFLPELSPASALRRFVSWSGKPELTIAAAHRA